MTPGNQANYTIAGTCSVNGRPVSTTISGATTATISQSDAATYKVEITKPGCKATAQLTIIKAPLPVGKLPNREVICNDVENKDPKTNNVDLDPGSFAKYNWFKNELSINYTQMNW